MSIAGRTRRSAMRYTKQTTTFSSNQALSYPLYTDIIPTYSTYLFFRYNKAIIHVVYKLLYGKNGLFQSYALFPPEGYARVIISGGRGRLRAFFCVGEAALYSEAEILLRACDFSGAGGPVPDGGYGLRKGSASDGGYYPFFPVGCTVSITPAKRRAVICSCGSASRMWRRRAMA